MQKKITRIIREISKKHDFFSRFVKKKVRNFLNNLVFFIFLEFFTDYVLKCLLRVRETFRNKEQ